MISLALLIMIQVGALWAFAIALCVGELSMAGGAATAFVCGHRLSCIVARVAMRSDARIPRARVASARAR